jgi:hypothetical protein
MLYYNVRMEGYLCLLCETIHSTSANVPERIEFHGVLLSSIGHGDRREEWRTRRKSVFLEIMFLFFLRALSVEIIDCNYPFIHSLFAITYSRMVIFS